MPDTPEAHIDRFLDRVAQLKSGHTHMARQSALQKFNEWLSANNHSLPDIGPLDIEDFLFKLADEGYASNTINTYYHGVLVFFRYLDRQEVVPENPVVAVERSTIRSLSTGTGKTQEADVVYVTEAEKEALVETAPIPKLRNRLLLRLLWQTGVRVGELVTMKLEYVDREARSIRVYASKTDSWRTVYYQPSLDFLLTQWVEEGYRDSLGPAAASPYLFPSSRSEHLGTVQVQKIVSRAADAAGIQETLYTNAAGQPINRITPHAFRHGNAVKLLKDGVPTRFVQEHFGHADLSTTEHYLQVIESDVKDSIHDKWTDNPEHL